MRRHVADADVDGFGLGVGGVEVALDGLVEDAACVQDEVDGVAAGSLASGVGCDVVRGGLGLLAGVCGGDGEAYFAHHGEVDDVIADVGDLVEGAAFFRDDLVERVDFVGLTLIDVVDLEVAGADGDYLRVALGDPADLEAGEAGDADAHAVMGGEGFDLGGMAFGVAVEGRDDGDVAVGEDAVYVVEEDFDAAGTVFGGENRHVLMIVEVLRGRRESAATSPPVRNVRVQMGHPDG